MFNEYTNQKEFDITGWWTGSIYVDQNHVSDSALDMSVNETDRSMIRSILENWEPTDDVAGKEVVSVSYLNDYIRDEVYNQIMAGDDYGTVCFDGEDISWNLDIDCTLDGKEVDWRDLSDGSREHIACDIIEDGYKQGEICELGTLEEKVTFDELTPGGNTRGSFEIENYDGETLTGEVRWSKRCKDPALVGTVKEVVHQVSHSKKWASRKITDENGHTQIIKSYSLLQDRFFEHMQAAGFEDFERGERGSTAEHLSVIEYKSKKESERLAGYEAKQSEVLMEIDALTKKKEEAREQADTARERADIAAARLNELAPKLKNIEDFAREYSDDADRVLPEAGALESAKSYREKKAKPFFEKLTKVLRSLYSKYLDLKHSFERLRGDYSRLQQRYASLDASFDRVQEENQELKAVAKDYDTLCRGYGEKEIAARVRAIQEQEEAERRQHRAAHHRYEVGVR